LEALKERAMDAGSIYQFNRLDETAKQVVLTLAKCAAREPAGHEIQIGSSGDSKRPYSYTVVFSDLSRPCPNIKTSANLRNFLIDQGFVTIQAGGDFSRFPFKREVLEWLLELYPLTDAEVRAAIGRYFYQLDQKEPGEPHLFDAQEVSEKLLIPTSRVETMTRLLAGVGLLQEDGPGGAGRPPYYKLSREVERLPIDEEEKNKVELAMRRLEDELQKDHPRYEVIKDALEMAAHFKEVLIPLVPILASNLDKLQHAVQVIQRLPLP
jgi:hypothetical protein